jgi:hypothetical protein
MQVGVDDSNMRRFVAENLRLRRGQDTLKAIPKPHWLLSVVLGESTAEVSCDVKLGTSPVLAGKRELQQLKIFIAFVQRWSELGQPMQPHNSLKNLSFAKTMRGPKVGFFRSLSRINVNAGRWKTSLCLSEFRAAAAHQRCQQSGQADGHTCNVPDVAVCGVDLGRLCVCERDRGRRFSYLIKLAFFIVACSISSFFERAKNSFPWWGHIDTAWLAGAWTVMLDHVQGRLSHLREER